MDHTLELEILKSVLGVCKMSSSEKIPVWAKGEVLSMTWTADELSIICEEIHIPKTVEAERDFRCFKVTGFLAFGTPGIFASIANPLAVAGISIFAFSTYNTDYFLIKSNDLQKTIEVLQGAGHTIF